MEGNGRAQRDGSPTSPTPSSSHRRVPSGSSLLSRFPFMKTSQDPKPRADRDDRDFIASTASRSTPRASSTIIHHQQKTRRRRGSLRKVALLGRGAQRDRKDSKPLTIDTSHAAAFGLDPTSTQTQSPEQLDSLTYKGSLLPTPIASTDTIHRKSSPVELPTLPILPTGGDASHPDQDTHGSYTSTDEEDMLQIPGGSVALRQGLAMSSGPDSYFGVRGSDVVQRRRSIHRAKSPLSYGGLSTTSTLPAHEAEWDYSDTEWWGWVVLCVTWFVFVIGMGSCFDIWSWAWDVGKTPYAPPELEDDPTLPIVGYYPALIILTGIMAWVWVLTAWVGMKYFRHAKISGD
ncbi:hypothetical protein EDB81DRAFT_281542 [Dactylonectria macrodidyma]|uniref:Uncharacterized protein n=1 Tax=Dactylonectria macrodidyma TaxID=307937 RepID=A0A9P9FNL0_9HYPO|nr:hypothetical protein EDB81DRAFT_281542 [Dactylonectria macrodidyma]